MEFLTAQNTDGTTSIAIVGDHEKTAKLCQIMDAGWGQYADGLTKHNKKTGKSTAEWSVPDHMVLPFKANYQISLGFVGK